MITTMPFKESTALEEKNSQNERGSMASTATFSAATKLAWLASGVNSAHQKQLLSCSRANSFPNLERRTSEGGELRAIAPDHSRI
jgi:hypothetical protein